MWKWFQTNWERSFLFVISLIFLTFSIKFLLKSEVAGSTAAFVMFFLCLIYANVSRFRRFKGLGFEAELWEDKQKEAADLIERLKNIVQVYTREIIMTKVMAGRWGGGSAWPDRWALYEELVGQHDTLGQKIDFLPLKEKVYRVMVFDAVNALSSKVQQALSKSYSDINNAISKEFGNPIADAAGYGARIQTLNASRFEIRDLFTIAESGNVASYVLENVDKSVKALKDNFGVEVLLPSEEIEKLKKIDTLFRSGDLKVDPELLTWADGRG
jgi:hypothetical protein